MKIRPTSFVVDGNRCGGIPKRLKTSPASAPSQYVEEVTEFELMLSVNGKRLLWLIKNED